MATDGRCENRFDPQHAVFQNFCLGSDLGFPSQTPYSSVLRRASDPRMYSLVFSVSLSPSRVRISVRGMFYLTAFPIVPRIYCRLLHCVALSRIVSDTVLSMRTLYLWRTRIASSSAPPLYLHIYQLLSRIRMLSRIACSSFRRLLLSILSSYQCSVYISAALHR